MTSDPSIPKRVVILPQSDGDVVARHTELGKVVGEFYQIPSGEIYFGYCEGGGCRWYVNRSITAFREAAAIFNRCCELHADDEDTDDEAAWSLVVAQLKREFESVEPLGDPETSLWSATIHDTEGGLLSLY
ncbi:MAG: hypothetical protein JWR69_4742 [Pedosphaera sp.]|nr:hypothetical protein [Pedosphaera sp.]